MTARQLGLWCASVKDKDRPIPPEIVLSQLDWELEERLNHLLSQLAIHAPEPVQSEALALKIRLMIAE